jgi:hypothetical protein
MLPSAAIGGRRCFLVMAAGRSYRGTAAHRVPARPGRMDRSAGDWIVAEALASGTRAEAKGVIRIVSPELREPHSDQVAP